MRFLGDMGISQRVIEWLRQQGHDVSHLREQGLHRLPDGEIFSKAASEERTIITFDLDFGEIAAQCEKCTVSVVIFRLRNTRTSNVISRLKAVLKSAPLALENGAIVIVEETRFRIRNYPSA